MESANNESSVKIEPKEYAVNVKIPDECLDPDGGDCPCVVHEVKKDYNPV